MTHTAGFCGSRLTRQVLCGVCVRLVRPSQSVDKRSKQQRRDPRTFALFAFSLSLSLVLHVQQVPRDWEHIAKGTHCTFCFGPIQGQHAIWLFRQFRGGVRSEKSKAVESFPLSRQAFFSALLTRHKTTTTIALFSVVSDFRTEKTRSSIATGSFFFEYPLSGDSLAQTDRSFVRLRVPAWRVLLSFLN